MAPPDVTLHAGLRHLRLRLPVVNNRFVECVIGPTHAHGDQVNVRIVRQRVREIRGGGNVDRAGIGHAHGCVGRRVGLGRRVRIVVSREIDVRNLVPCAQPDGLGLLKQNLRGAQVFPRGFRHGETVCQTSEQHQNHHPHHQHRHHHLRQGEAGLRAFSRGQYPAGTAGSQKLCCMASSHVLKRQMNPARPPFWGSE